MKKILLFVLENCPYCKKALRYQDDLMRENPALRQLDIQIVDEAVEVDFANAHDYYYVPTYYVGGVKVHEGAADRAAVESVLKKAME